MQLADKIYVAGHTGLVGSALVRALKQAGYSNLVFRTKEELDLLNQQAVYNFYQAVRPDYVFDAAAKVGGILANNTFRGQFIFENLLIQSNLIHGAYLAQAKKLLFLASSCIYPKMAKQPITEDQLLTGPLEPTNEPYAIAKIAGLKMCQAYHDQYGCNFISIMPTNLYGPNDSFDTDSSHVLPALIRRFHEAKVNRLPDVTIWGSGTPRREFLYVDDLADACVFLMKNYDDPKIINVGTGQDISISELALRIKKIVGYEGEIKFDRSKLDGTPQKLLDVIRLNDIGWRPVYSLESGLRLTYEWYFNNSSKQSN